MYASARPKTSEEEVKVSRIGERPRRGRTSDLGRGRLCDGENDSRDDSDSGEQGMGREVTGCERLVLVGLRNETGSVLHSTAVIVRVLTVVPSSE